MQKQISTLTGIIIILAVTIILFGGVFIYQYLIQKESQQNLIQKESQQTINIVGAWRNDEDSKNILVYYDDGTYKEFFGQNSEFMAKGRWLIYNATNKECGDNKKGQFICLKHTPDTLDNLSLYFGIDLDEKTLCKTYLVRGKGTCYTKINSTK